MPKLFVFRPGSIFDLGDKQRANEDRALAPERDWRFVLLNRVQQLTQLDRFLIAPASAAAADIDEPIFFQRRQQEPTDRARYGLWLIADDDETVAAPASDLLPPVAAAAVIGLFPVLGDYSLKTMLAGNAVELVAVSFDLFRQPDDTCAAGDDLLEQPSALAKRLTPLVVPVEIEQIEGEEEDFARIMQAGFPAKSTLQCAVIRSSPSHRARPPRRRGS